MDKKRFKLKDKHILSIWQDSDAESPDAWKNEDMFLVYDHRQFTVERSDFKPKDIYDYIIEYDAETSKDLRISEYNKYHIFTVYAYIHSGVSLSLAHQGCRFDTSSTGFILIKKDILQQGAGNVEEDLTKEEASKYAEGLISTWNTYLSGEIFGFTIIKQINKAKELTSLILEQFDKTKYLDKLGREFTNTMVEDTLTKHLHDSLIEEESIDSCGGFYYSTDEQLLTDMLDNINENLYSEPSKSIEEIALALLL